MERAEVAGLSVAAVLAAPLIMLRACLCPAAHDRGTKSGDSGAEQCGKSCVHGLSLPSLSFIQCVSGWRLLTARSGGVAPGLA